jgi:hypothetical protein
MADLTAAGRSVIGAADTAAQRTVLGLGTAAVVAIGTSDGTLGLLNTANTWSAAQTIAADTYLVAPPAPQSALVRTIASAVNYFRVSGGTAASAVDINYLGSDTNVFAAHATKGSGAHYYYTSSTDRQFVITHTAGAVNYWSVTGGATGANSTLSATGSDSSTSAVIVAKGSAGTVDLSTNTSGNVQLRVRHTASTANCVTITGAATGSGPVSSAEGSDTNINNRRAAKGTGTHIFQSAAGGTTQMVIGAVASAANYLNAQGATTTSYPSVTANGPTPTQASTSLPREPGRCAFSPTRRPAIGSS